MNLCCRRALILIAVSLLQIGSAWADPFRTHIALAELFFPQKASTELGPRLYQDSWPAARQSFPASTWSRLEHLSNLPLSIRHQAFAAIGKDSETAALYLRLRHFYLGWYYSGERGRQAAGLSTSEPDRTATSPPTFTSPLRLDSHEIRWTGKEIDYLIVGSGPAGSVLGYELSRVGFRTVLVERGSFVLPDQVDTREVPALKLGDGAVPTADGSVLVRHGSTVGGGSTVNVDLAFAPTLPFVRSRFEQWRQRGLIGPAQWSPEEIARAYEWVKEKIGTREPGLEEINGNNAVLWDGATLLGLRPQLYGLNTSPGLPEHLNKRSSVKTLILEAMVREVNPLVVIPDLDVRQVLRRGRTASGVRAVKRAPWNSPAVLEDPAHLSLRTGQSYQLRARNVILCAGAQGSAAVLLRSGLGGDQVGRGLILHPSMPLIGLFDRSINALQGTASTVYVVDDRDPGLLYECMTGSPDYVATMLFGTGPEIADRIQHFNNLGGFGVLLVDSVEQENRISLDHRGEAVVEYHLNSTDKLRLRQGLARAVAIMLEAGAREVYLPSNELTSPDTSAGHLVKFRSHQDLSLIEQIHFRPAQTVLTSAHMQSTCKMGQVVDQEHRVRGMDNLYVCDSSIFPGSVGANPMQTIYTVAKLFTERLTQSTSDAALSPGPRAP